MNPRKPRIVDPWLGRLRRKIFPLMHVAGHLSQQSLIRAMKSRECQGMKPRKRHTASTSPGRGWGGIAGTYGNQTIQRLLEAEKRRTQGVADARANAARKVQA